jgi:2-keto-3-deoxy-L-rhamnonate aldolase RhmA
LEGGQVLHNLARVRLERGELALGIGLRQARTVDIAPAMATVGLDWLFIDLEHSTMSLDTAMQISVAAHVAGLAPLVRVPYRRYDMATRALDGGALGIVMPHVDTAEEARDMAVKLRYPPDGCRSMAAAMPQLGFAVRPIDEMAREVNSNLLLITMLETPKAIANAEAIAAIDGIDALLIGTSDLTMEMGIPGQLVHADVIKAYETAAAACKRHGKWLGAGGVYSDEGLTTYIGIGARLVLIGSDLSLLINAASARVRSIRGIS